MTKETTISKLQAAFERLKNDEPIIKSKGTKVNVLTVQQEAGFTKGTMTAKKHSALFIEVNEYKHRLEILKAREASLEELSKEESIQAKYKTAEMRRKKYYAQMIDAKDELARHQEREVMVLQAMFEILDVHAKSRLIDAGNEGTSGKQVVTYESIKKIKATGKKNYLKEVK